MLQSGQADQALALYQTLVRADPQDRDSRMGVAASLSALGQVNEALAEYEQIGVEWPDFPFASVRRGELFEAQGDLEGAIDAYRAAVQAAPDNADLHFTLAFTLRRAGQVEEAILEFQSGLKIDPTLTDSSSCAARTSSRPTLTIWLKPPPHLLLRPGCGST